MGLLGVLSADPSLDHDVALNLNTPGYAPVPRAGANGGATQAAAACEGGIGAVALAVSPVFGGGGVGGWEATGPLFGVAGAAL